MQGYVLDGFPQNAAQAAALEKLLTGLDLESDQAFRDAASVIAPPPLHWLPDDTRTLQSGQLPVPTHMLLSAHASAFHPFPSLHLVLSLSCSRQRLCLRYL